MGDKVILGGINFGPSPQYEPMHTPRCITPAQMEIAWYRMTWGKPLTIRSYREYLAIQAELLREAQKVEQEERTGLSDCCPVCRAPRKCTEGHPAEEPQPPDA